MKFFGIILSLLLSTQSFAEVYKCTTAPLNGDASTVKVYLLALTEENIETLGTGFFFTQTNGTFLNVRGQVLRGAWSNDGVLVVFSPYFEADWSKPENRCYASAPDKLVFELSRLSNGELEGVRQSHSAFVANPNTPADSDCPTGINGPSIEFGPRESRSVSCVTL